MKSIGIIGYGALGKILSSIVVERLSEDYSIAGIYDFVLEDSTVDINGTNVKVFANFEELLRSEAELVVEIAGVGAVKELVIPLLEAEKDLVITSVGALADRDTLDKITETAKKKNRKVHITSGAIGGFDILSTLGLMGNGLVSIESTKAPKSLNGAPYLKGKELPEDCRSVVFEGGAREAILGFPKNTNVSVATGLASGAVDGVKVRIISDPAAQGNTHKICIENHIAKAIVEVNAKTDPKNPKSSVTAAWSVAALLKNLANPLQLF